MYTAHFVRSTLESVWDVWPRPHIYWPRPRTLLASLTSLLSAKASSARNGLVSMSNVNEKFRFGHLQGSLKQVANLYTVRCEWSCQFSLLPTAGMEISSLQDTSKVQARPIGWWYVSMLHR